MKPAPKQNYRKLLEHWADEEQLSLLGIVGLEYQQNYDNFVDWLENGFHGEMAFLERYQEIRADPVQLLAGAQSAVILGMPYFLGDKWQPLTEWETPQVAQYARLPDYHRVLRKKSDRIAKKLMQTAKDPNAYRICVDTAPLLEKALASKVPLGFYGKNTCFIHAQKGSYFLISEIVTSMSLKVDRPSDIQVGKRGDEGGCGSCRECQIHCPTGALDRAYSMDATKCIAYWTIEHRGPIPLKYWPWLKHYVFGCDICQLVCPYNQKVDLSAHKMSERPVPSLFEMATMDQKAYEAYFGGTPATRAKRNGLKRNALIAMTVTGDEGLKEAMAVVRQQGGYPLEETLEQIPAFFESAFAKNTGSLDRHTPHGDSPHSLS